ncbi:NADPH-dependent F420 reductase [Pseudaminobacter soli (ex Li et al. 2025)]|uniref:3-hydroxyisobutyrate dehydrogenase n=1 Tax=Pseudaminobacter soli (ex Li et al. 2025) TaxID=1295366 RepID=A0A2P7RK06_9HYPH|nr:NAD(P)-binding domain-containing protein [Mesorhizobium soli]PSJ50546.1 3-hydroxyisobutyrate dehydrogenase [Mesorhizobium soli]
MKIGIIGAGHVGAALAKKFVTGGHAVKIANSRQPETIFELARNLGVAAVSKEQVVKDVDVVVVSIPFSKSPVVAGLFRDVPTEVVVIDTSNYFPFRDGKISEVDAGMPESVWVSEQIGRPVVKAWNSLMAVTLSTDGKPKGTNGRIAVPIAGDDTRGKVVTGELVDLTGFDPVGAGPLTDSWRLQPGSPAYCTELTRDELIAALASANIHRLAGNRETLITEIATSGGNLTHHEIIALTRRVTA